MSSKHQIHHLVAMATKMQVMDTSTNIVISIVVKCCAQQIGEINTTEVLPIKYFTTVGVFRSWKSWQHRANIPSLRTTKYCRTEGRRHQRKCKTEAFVMITPGALIWMRLVIWEAFMHEWNLLFTIKRCYG